MSRHCRRVASITGVVIALGSSAGAFGALGGSPYGYVSGWQKQERDRTGRTYRWMGTTARLIVFGQPRPRARLSMQAFSLLRPRRLTIAYEGRTLRTVTVPADRWKTVSLVVPAGPKPAFLTLSARPKAVSATAVNRTDHRKLAVAVSRVNVTFLH